jgi:hypothetical protein
MVWQEFMRMERRRLNERRQGKLRQALGELLWGETVEQLDRLGEEDRLRACQGLVAIVGADGRASYRHIDALGREEMEDRLAAEWLEEGWLKQRAKRRRNGAEALSISKHLGELLRTPYLRSSQNGSFTHWHGKYRQQGRVGPGETNEK